MTLTKDIFLFLPELILCAGSIALILASLAKWRMGPYLAFISLASSLYFTVFEWGAGPASIFYNMLSIDGHAEFFRIIFIITVVIIVFFSHGSKELAFRERISRDECEYYALITALTFCMMILAESRNILMIYLALESVGLCSYILVGFVRDSIRSSEAALKYVLFGAVASGVFLFGASQFYGMTGSLDITNIMHTSPAHKLAGLFMLAGFLFKIAAVPMHSWCPDAYEGAPMPITAFLSVAPKAAGFAVLMRVSRHIGIHLDWPIIIAVISAVTMTFGNLAAIPQTNVKRLLAYSSIAHAGYILMGVACLTTQGTSAVYFYFIAYLVMNLGAFLAAEIVLNEFGSDEISAFRGLSRMGSFGTIISISMAVFLLSLTGVPPFVGFIGKFYLFSAVIDAKLFWLAIVGIINSVISLYYYMRIVKAMFFDAPEKEFKMSSRPANLYIILGSLSILAVVLGLAWGPLARVIISL